jgi:hypothetical protein
VSKQIVDPLGKSLSESAYDESSQDHDLDQDREQTVLERQFNTFWHRIRNLWYYPATIRKHLRTAVFYHLYSNDIQSNSHAEAAYLLAWKAAEDDPKTSLDLKAGLALQIGRFYSDVGHWKLSAKWYAENGLPLLIAWYTGGIDVGRKSSIRNWDTAVGQERLERLAAILIELAENSSKCKHGDSPRDWAPLTPDRYYSQALTTLLINRKSETLVQAHLARILRGESSNLTPPSSTAPSQSTPRPAALLALLERMAGYYKDLRAPQYVALLRNMQLQHLPPENPDGAADSRDRICRRATVMNNLADAIVEMTYSKDQEGSVSKVTQQARSLHLLKQAEEWLLRALPAADASRSHECGECRTAILNNLGRVCEEQSRLPQESEERSVQKMAIQYYQEALNLARARGDVDARREAQINLSRFEGVIEPDA